jgi:hypothetical protein
LISSLFPVNLVFSIIYFCIISPRQYFLLPLGGVCLKSLEWPFWEFRSSYLYNYLEMMLVESMLRVTFIVKVYFCIPEIFFFVSPCHDALVIIWRMIHFIYTEMLYTYNYKLEILFLQKMQFPTVIVKKGIQWNENNLPLRSYLLKFLSIDLKIQN